MEPVEPPTGRSIRLALVSVGLLALLAVVAFASRSGLGHQSNASPTPGYVSYAFTAFLIVFVLAIPVAAYAFLLQAREGGVARKSFRSRVLQNIATAVAFGLVAFVIFYVKTHHGHLLGLNTKALKDTSNALKLHKGSALFVAHRKRRRALVPLELGPTVAEDLAASITDAIDDLEAEPDARRAVIAAYARMEAVLGRHGLRRRPSETPFEYLQRILLGLTGRSAAVQRLTSLFEHAKFSRHEIDAAMKHEAIAALREIRDDLHGAPA
jgi:hypothetical protein